MGYLRCESFDWKTLVRGPLGTLRTLGTLGTLRTLGTLGRTLQLTLRFVPVPQHVVLQEAASNVTMGCVTVLLSGKLAVNNTILLITSTSERALGVDRDDEERERKKEQFL